MILCDRCERHYRASDSRCPFCSRSRPAVTALNAVGGLVTTFVLAACYGGAGGIPNPDTGPVDTSHTGDTAISETGDPSVPIDNDGDGFFSDVDCNDTDPAIYPGQTEACDDGIDNDCDELVDQADPDC